MTRLTLTLAQAIEKWPGQLAVVDGNVRWTYAQLGSESGKLQERLWDAGFHGGERVVLWLKNSSFYIAAYLAVLALDGVVVGIHPDVPPAEVLRTIAHVNASGIVTTRHQWEKHGAAFRQFGLRFALFPDSIESLGSPASSEMPPDGLALILYTSGTTGSPKGVMISHENLLANVESILARLDLSPSDATVAVLPFVFSYGNSILLTHLFAGARIICEENLLYPHCVIEAMKKEAATGFSGVASNYAFLLRESGFRSENLPSLRYFTSAGGPMPDRLLAKVRKAFPKAKFHVMYGQTEATARITMLGKEELERKPGSAGRAVPGVYLAILDEHELRLPAGTPGEIAVAGRSVMKGYWRDSAGTAGTLKNGWLHTGDLGYLDEEGFLFIAGRKSEIIKTGGFRVSPAEIEEVLSGHEDVLEAAVAGVADPTMGEAIVAGVVLKPGRKFSVQRLMAFCLRQLAPFKRPKAVYPLNAVLRSANGKILRRAMEEQLSALHRNRQQQSKSYRVDPL